MTGRTGVPGKSHTPENQHGSCQLVKTFTSPQLWPAADPARQERLDGRTTRDDAMTLAFNERAVRDDFEAK